MPDPSVAFVWRGDPNAPPAERRDRVGPLFDAFDAAGLAAEPVTYDETIVDDVRERLKDFDAVLVWVNPIDAGRDRSSLDQVLRDVADAGVFVSTHPDVIGAMGTKEVLHATRELGWGVDTHVHRSLDELKVQLPELLASGPRVLKQYRGNGGDGTWKVEYTERNGEVLVDHAMQWNGEPKRMTLDDFFVRMERFVQGDGRLVDQPFMDRLHEGLVRAYCVHDEVVGFTHQHPRGLLPNRSEELRTAPMVRAPMEDVDTPARQTLRWKVQSEWVPQMMEVLAIERDRLPIIWDADFLFGPKEASGADTYVLCEINVSAVWPFPEQACAKVAEATAARVRSVNAST